jgi:hypothetical protein
MVSIVTADRDMRSAETEVQPTAPAVDERMQRSVAQAMRIIGPPEVTSARTLE